MKPGSLFRLRSGFILQGKQLWISELVSIIFLSVTSVVLLAANLKIIKNEYAIHRLEAVITKKKTEQIILVEYGERLKEINAVAELLCSIAGKKISPKILVNLAGIVYDNSIQFGYDPLLLLAVIEVESVFQADALGRYRNGTQSGALGLMQIKPETAREVAAQLHMPPLSRNDLFKPEINIVLGVSYLTRMISRFKSFKLGLLAYNQGPTAINKHLTENKPISIQYYRKVLNAYYALSKRAQVLSNGIARSEICR
jgi:soluble lytic murein transglycosylase-like protein